MSELLASLFALLVYPGLVMALAWTLLLGRLLEGPASGGRAIVGLVDALVGRGALSSGAAAILALLALIHLPWPAAPWQA